LVVVAGIVSTSLFGSISVLILPFNHDKSI
jgi:hypothetical protein